MCINHGESMYMYKKEMFEWIIAKDVQRIKYILTLDNLYFTNDFDSSGGRVMEFTASGHLEFVNRAKRQM